jgi:hypothetical protein
MKKLLFIVCICIFSLSNAQNGLLNGTGSAPNFSVTDLNGNSHVLYDYLDSGYVMVLELLSVTCGHCQTHAAGTENSFLANGASGTNIARFLGLEVNASSDSAAVANFATNYGVTFPIANNVSPTAINYELYYTPGYYVIYPDYSYTTICAVSCVTAQNSSTIEGLLNIAISSWAPPVYGCTNPFACNYDLTATQNDGSCLTDYGCTNPAATNYDPIATCLDTCFYTFGCTDSTALNYNPLADTDDSSCTYCYATADIGADTINACDSVLISTNPIINGTYCWNNPPLSNGVVAYYPFNANANDESGNGNNGIVNGATLTTDRFGNLSSAYSFDGSDDYINIGTDQMLNRSNTDFSINVWINTNTLSPWFSTIITNRNSNYQGSLFGIHQDQLGLTSGDPNNAYTNNVSFSTEQWYNVCVTHENSSDLTNFYIDGTLIYSTTSFGDFPAPNPPTFHSIGAEIDGNNNGLLYYPFDGEIDDMYLFNRVLTSPEIQALYNNTSLCNNDSNVLKVTNSGWNYVTVMDSLVCIATDSVYVQIDICGCTDSMAFNYDSLATVDDSSCIAVVNGCTDSTACNYDAAANTDNGSCNYSTTSTTTVTACDSFEWNGTTYDSSGTYSYTGSYTGTSNNFSLNISYNEFISIPALSPPASNTLSAWIEFPLPGSEDTLTWNTLFSKQGGNYHHLYFGVNGELGIYNGGSHVGCGYYASNISSGFHYITAVSNNSQTQFYVDGINVGSVSPVITEPIGIIGNFDGNGTQPIGNIDDVSIWSYNLSNQEILNYMYCSPIGSESGLTAYWNFESGNGGYAYNQTIHAYDGIITGANYDTIVPSQSCQLTNSNGCDSTAILNLTINNLASTLNTVSICSGDSFTVGTNTYDTDNTYTDVLTTINGCDSTVTTILTIDPLGCTDSSAFNYNASAVCDDSSCIVTVNGCTDTAAFNYNFSANVDDGSCIATILGCTNQFAYNYNAAANTDDGSCVQFILGCTNEFAYNYNFSANVDDGSCVPFIFGCTDSLAFNFYSAANSDDGSCTYLSCNEDSPSGLFASDVIHNRATINWDNMNSSLCIVDQYRIRYRETGTSSWSAKTMSGPLGSCNYASQKTDKLILNLTANTTYEYHMKAWYCGGSNSSWSAIATFTTLANCPNVGSLAVTGVNPTKATFTWDASNGVYSFVRLKARVNSISNPTGANFFQIGGAGVSYGTWTKNKNGLIPGETYRGQARTYCDPSGGGWKSLSWTPLVYWTQPTLRIEGGNAIANLDVYPNPSRDVFNINFTSERVQDLRVRVMNAMGEEIVKEELEQFIGEYTQQINLKDNAKGIYFLEIKTNDGIINKKLILQ